MKIGIIGGSGLYQVEGIGEARKIKQDTPFGNPSSEYYAVENNGNTFYFLPRHGARHQILPSEINHQANIMGFKMLGADQVIGISAVGSLQTKYRPRDVVLVDQYFDRTKTSKRHTFFGRGIVGHIAFADPICEGLRGYLNDSLSDLVSSKPEYHDLKIHHGGTYINMEGPAFSTRAESRFYHQQGFDIIGMTTLAEAKLCREAGMCYACMSMVTDYDSWHSEEEAVTAEMVIETLKSNVVFANDFIRLLVQNPPLPQSGCACREALKTALMTAEADMPEQTRQDLMPILATYLKN
jgi:5'-methylthioadenosine phosphorylase